MNKALDSAALIEAFEHDKVTAALRARVQRDNPSLNAEDVDTVVAFEWRLLYPAPVPSCCACQKKGRAEWVRVGPQLGICECGCH